MRKISATITRNKIRTGKNSKSYDAKHPENPVLYGVVSAAKKRAVNNGNQLRFIDWVSKLSKPEINRLLA